MPAATVATPTVPVYPPVDPGIQLIDSDAILQGQSEMLARLRVLAGGDADRFQRFYLTIVRTLADYIQLLPASQTDTHSGAGGLFRLCLEMGFFSLQSAERVVFAEQETVEIRRELEPRWRYAVFLAGLCSELYRPLSDMTVTNAKGQLWPKYLKSLSQWGAEEGNDRYFVQWQKPKSLHTHTNGRADVAVLMRSILPDYALQYLEDGSASIIPVVFAVASGATHPSDNQVARIVYEVRQRILKRDQALRKENYGKLIVGNHLEPYLLDAMRALYRKGTWKVNQEKSRLWMTQEGLFLIWKSGAKEILQTLVETGVTGAPQDIATLAEMMADAGIIARNGNSTAWMISPPGASDSYQAVRIAEPIAVLEDDEVDPVEVTFSTGTTNPSARSTAPAPAPSGANGALNESKRAEDTQPPMIRAKPKAKQQPEPIDAQKDLLVDENAASTLTAEAKEEVSAAKETTAQESVERRQPRKPREPKPDPDAVIAPPPAALSSFAENVRPDARAVLKPDVLEVIGKMIDDYKKGRNRQAILDTADGIAFENQLVLRYGLSYDRIVGTLHNNEWLQAPPGNPNAKNIKIKNEGKQMTCIVIKTKAAKFLGFYEDEE